MILCFPLRRGEIRLARQNHAKTMIPRVCKQGIIVKCNENVQLQGCAMPYQIAPCLFKLDV
jgi:hypothetical protein